jgi:hypothetical protein
MSALKLGAVAKPLEEEPPKVPAIPGLRHVPQT